MRRSKQPKSKNPPITPAAVETYNEKPLYESYQETEKNIIAALNTENFDPGFFDRDKVITSLKGVFEAAHFSIGSDIIDKKPADLTDEECAWLYYRISDYSVEFLQFYKTWRPFFQSAYQPDAFQHLEKQFEQHFLRLQVLQTVAASRHPQKEHLQRHNFAIQDYQSHYTQNDYWYWQGVINGMFNDNEMYYGFYNSSYYDGYLTEKGVELIVYVAKRALGEAPRLFKASIELASGAAHDTAMAINNLRPLVENADALVGQLGNGVKSFAQAVDHVAQELPHVLAEVKEAAGAFIDGAGGVAKQVLHEGRPLLRVSQREAYHILDLTGKLGNCCLDGCKSCGECVQCLCTAPCEAACKSCEACIACCITLLLTIGAGITWLSNQIKDDTTGSHSTPSPNPHNQTHPLTAAYASSQTILATEHHIPYYLLWKDLFGGLFLLTVGGNVAATTWRLAKNIKNDIGREQNVKRLLALATGALAGFFVGLFIPTGGIQKAGFLLTTIAFLGHFLIDRYYRNENKKIYDGAEYPEEFWLTREALSKLQQTIADPYAALRILLKTIKTIKDRANNEADLAKHNANFLTNTFSYIWQYRLQSQTPNEKVALAALAGFRRGVVNNQANKCLSLMGEEEQQAFAPKPPADIPSAQADSGNYMPASVYVAPTRQAAVAASHHDLEAGAAGYQQRSQQQSSPYDDASSPYDDAAAHQRFDL